MVKATEGLRLVEMQDGRKVSFGKRAKMVKGVLRDAQMLPLAVRFDFENGETRLVELDKIPEATREELLAHGAKQKIGDECADLDSVGDYVAAVEAMIDRLCDGVWREEREGGFAGSAVLIEACMEIFSKTREEVREILKGMKPGERNALRQSPEIKPAADWIEAEKSKGVDLTPVLAKFQ